MSTFEIRTLTLGEVLDEAFELFRRAFTRLIAFQIVAFVPVAAAEVVAIKTLGDLVLGLLQGSSESAVAGPIAVVLAAGGAVMFVQILVAPLIGVALTRAVADTYLERPWKLKDLLRAVADYGTQAILVGVFMLALLFAVVLVPAVFVGGIAYTIWTGGALEGAGYLLLIVVASFVAGLPVLAAAIYLNLRYMLSFAVLVVEGTGVVGAFRRSAELMKGRYWSAFGLWLILLMVSLLFGFAASLLVPSPSFETLDPDQVRRLLPLLIRSQMISTVLSEAIGMFTRTYGIIAWTLFYFSARCAREGFDLMVLARRFAVVTTAGERV